MIICFKSLLFEEEDKLHGLNGCITGVLKIHVRNKKFRDKSKDFVKSALKLLNDFLNRGERVQYSLTEEVIREGEGSITFRTVPKPDFSLFISHHIEDIQKLEEYKSLIDFMLSVEEIRESIAYRFIEKKIPSKIGYSSSYWVNFVMNPILHAYVKNAGKFEFDEGVFNDLYTQIEEYYYSSELNFRAFAPLYNFRTTEKKIDLGDNLSIRKITEQEINEMWNWSKYGGFPYNRNAILDYNFAIELLYTRKKENETTTPSLDDVFNKVVTALRLFKKGATGYNFISHYPDQWMPMSSVSTSGGQYPRLHYGLTYKLEKEEVVEFQKFWEEFKQVKLDDYPFLNLALRRFNLAQEKAELHDKIIDYFIAFEALYLKENEFQELRYRFALRTSHLLGQDLKERKEIFSFLNKAYIIRSKIVHGIPIGYTVKIAEEEMSLREFADKTEEYLRKSLLKFLELTKSYNSKEIFKLMDENILS